MKSSNKTIFCLCICAFLLFSCKKKTNSKSGNATTSTTAATDTKSTVKNKPATIDPVKTTKTDKPEIDAPEETPIKTGSIASLCGDANFDIDKAVNSAAKKLTGTPYSQENKTDCSGMFHKMLNTFRPSCPNASLPTIDNARDSRDLAAWYNENGNLKIIRDPAKNADLIQVGTVMFYGYQNRRNDYDFQNMDMKTLTTRSVGINHVSIVTSVNRVNGVLESYEMFHGRKSGVAASVSGSNRVTSWDKTWPMYGNAMEPWLAVAQPFGNK